MSAPWTVIEGDCFAAMAELPGMSVGHVITDPPYSAGVHRKVKSVRGRVPCSVDLGFACIGEQECSALMLHFARLVRRWRVIFSCDELVQSWRAFAHSEHIRTGIWVRDSTPQLTGDRPASGHETINISHRAGKKRWNGGGRSAVYTHPIVRYGREHPTQKPVALMRDLVRDFTDPGDLILDPFAGSGTTGVAALMAGRRVILIESDPQHAETARRRCADAAEHYESSLDCETKALAMRRARQLSMTTGAYRW